MGDGWHMERALPGLLCAQPGHCCNCSCLAVSCGSVDALHTQQLLLGVEGTPMGLEAEIQCHAVEEML